MQMVNSKVVSFIVDCGNRALRIGLELGGSITWLAIQWGIVSYSLKLKCGWFVLVSWNKMLLNHCLCFSLASFISSIKGLLSIDIIHDTAWLHSVSLSSISWFVNLYNYRMHLFWPLPKNLYQYIFTLKTIMIVRYNPSNNAYSMIHNIFKHYRIIWI